ncbi:BlaI/MecI/CopY family transcriptional regulator [Allorhodopirellula solitaria]|uniref:Penicillinase repressor n=1 Tax=Allorhodopirellula solitaria TaxID=2527987 RepID=A0A5C5X0H9_9BACT|nr:BlaI/MecI/CopY family transcriptional regulator [Allorhodopirellula solitaria]TWT55675.1 Penicillinase repressor [Allorhodopirellula solitaria]
MDTNQPDLPALSESQLEIMEIIWDLGEASARNVRQRLLNKREVARNTVRTLLQRMEEKGWLTHRQHGRTYLYTATRSRGCAVGKQVIEMLDQVCGGSPEALMAAIINYRGLSSAELNRIREMLDTAKTESKNSPKRGR